MQDIDVLVQDPSTTNAKDRFWGEQRKILIVLPQFPKTRLPYGLTSIATETYQSKSGRDQPLGPFK